MPRSRCSVGDVIVNLPNKNGGCTKAPVDWAVNDLYGVLITETPEVIAVSSEE